MSCALMDNWPTMASTGEAVLFWVFAVIMVLSALGVLLFQKAAYAVLSMVMVMLGIAVMFFMLQAPFNATVQIVVYTGAIMMMFLFVIMMIGLGATDQYKHQPRGCIILAYVMAFVLAIGLVVAVLISGFGSNSSAIFSFDVYSDQSIDALATELFQNHWVTIELAAALLVTAALGALVLTHSDRLGPKLSQEEVADARIRGFGLGRAKVSQRPAPGVYAHSNAVDNPAISGETLEPLAESIPRVLRISGADRPMRTLEPRAAAALLAVKRGKEQRQWGGHQVVERSGALGMPGAPAPTGLAQVSQSEVQQAQNQGGQSYTQNPADVFESESTSNTKEESE